MTRFARTLMWFKNLQLHRLPASSDAAPHHARSPTPLPLQAFLHHPRNPYRNCFVRLCRPRR
ncbi:hypothetical protein CVS37_20980 [Burkholderia lata]|nr:hypothetical protein CVS37_20980 [Burkholderia lata]